MKKVVLKTYNITKKYGEQLAVDNVNMTIKKGDIYGFIGQNGAGKTTLIRLITGLIHKSGGEIELLGANEENELNKARTMVGSLIETPSFYTNMTARENLEVSRLVRNIPGKKCIDEVLELVGLKDVEKKKVKNFSLGMRQRLGIASALMGNPKLLILDEPINGLDPLGIVEIRKLLIKLCDEKNMTILISSHNLPEMYQLANDYIFINKGEIIETLTLEELDEHCKHYLLLQSTDVCKLVNVIERKLNTTNFKVMPDNSVQLFDYIDDKELVGKTLFENEVTVTNLSNEGGTLEDYFVSMVGGIDNV